MSKVKFILSSLFFCSIILLISSCSKDSTCTPKSFGENLIGTWNITDVSSTKSKSGTGIFKADSTFTTVPDSLIVQSHSGTFLFPFKTYSVFGNTIRFTSSAQAGGAGFAVFTERQMTINECNKIELDLSNKVYVMTLTR